MSQCARDLPLEERKCHTLKAQKMVQPFPIYRMTSLSNYTLYIFYIDYINYF